MKKYIYKFMLVLSFFFVMGFGKCSFLEHIFLSGNYGSQNNYNAVTSDIDYFYYASNGGIIYKWTGDDGDPWSISYTVPGNPDLHDIKFSFFRHLIFCVGDNGSIARLDIDNSVWETVSSNVNNHLNKILVEHFSFGKVILVVGGAGTVLRSSDAGQSWIVLDFPTTDNLYDIAEHYNYTLEVNTIFVSGENYCFYKSTDDGETWVPTGPSDAPVHGPASSYNKIYFYDENIGYVGGPNGLILKTFDGGLTWGKRYASDFPEINDLFFISPDSGAAVGPNGIVRLTTDGGDNWFEDDSLTSFLNGETIKRIFPLSKNYGFVVGENGFDIFAAKDSTYLDSLPRVTNVEQQNSLVEKFQLEQNYPNPFNPTTSIQYSLSSRQFVTLKVYDVLGKEIATLVNEEKTAGIYEVEFDASEFPSGIYFYKLQAENFSETNKMVLMK